MKYNRKQWIGMGLALVMLLGVVGCGNKAEGTEGGNTTVYATRWSGIWSDDQKELVKNYKDSTIVIDDIAYDKLKEKESLSMQKSKGDYDLVYVAEVWCPDYSANKWITPLNDYIKKYNIDMSMYNQSLLDAMTVDGQIMALPTYTQTSILAYDSAAMKRYGKEVPATFEELIACAKWFQENEGSGIAIPAMQGQAAVDLFGSILYSCGGEFIKDGKLDLNSEQAKQAITIWKQLCQYSMDGSATWHVDDVAQAMKDGKAPISISLSGVCASYLDPEQSAVAQTVAFASMPGVNGQEYVGTANFWAWSVASNSKAPEEAFKAALWLTSPEQEKAASLSNGSISALPKLAEDQEVLAQIPYLPAVTEALKHARILPTAGDSSKMLTGLQAVLSEVAANSSADAVKVMRDYQTECESYQFQ